MGAVIAGTLQIVDLAGRIVDKRAARQCEVTLQQRRSATEREIALIQGGFQLAAGAISVLDSVAARRAGAAQQRIALAGEREFQRSQVERAQEFQRELVRLRHECDASLQDRIAALKAEGARKKADYQRMLAGYPVERPGHLREGLALVRPELSDMPPLVLLPPPHHADENSARRWGDMRSRIENDLHVLQQRGLVVIRRLKHPLSWPHSDFHTYDLTGIPTIVVQLSHDRELHSVRMGGCHLGPPDPGPVQDLQLVLEHRYLPASEWTPALLDTLNRTSRLPIRYHLPEPSDEASVQQLNHELVSRLVTLAVTAAVDTYQLMTRPGYDEQLDAALEAAGIAPEEWPADSGQLLDRIADPAYHLLHVTERLLRRGDQQRADQALRASLELLAGTTGAPGSPLPELSAAAVRSSDARPWHLGKLIALAEANPQLAGLAGVVEVATAALPAVQAHWSGHRPVDHREDSWDPAIAPV